MLLSAEEPPERLRGYLAAFSWIQAHRLYSADVLHTLERSWMRRARRTPA
jgi:thioesterase DpgC